MRVSRARRRVALTSLSLIVSAVFLFLAFRRIEWREAIAHIGTAHLWPWLPLSLSCCVAGYFVRGVRCRMLTSRWANLSTPTATNVVVVGYAVNNILPARLGELARSAMLSERTGIPLAQTLTVTFLERVVDGIVIIVFFLVARSLVAFSGILLGIERFAEVIFSAAGAAVVLAVIAPTFVRNVTSRVAAAIHVKLHDPALAVVTSVTNGVAYLRRPRDAASVFGLTFVVWGLEVAMFMFLLPAFDIPMRATSALVTMTVTNLGILLPSSPGFVGPFHYFCKSGLMFVGAPELPATSYAILVHFCFFLPITIWGVSALGWYGVQLGDALTQARLAKELTPDGAGEFVVVARADAPSRLAAAAVPSAFVRAVASALVPWDVVRLRKREREETLEAVALFVDGQVRALPANLGFLFGTGMIGFRILVRLGHLRGFCDLKSETQVRVVERWAYGKFALTRQLFRLVRSTALLAFYDHPHVHKAMAHPRRVGLKVVSGDATARDTPARALAHHPLARDSAAKDSLAPDPPAKDTMASLAAAPKGGVSNEDEGKKTSSALAFGAVEAEEAT